MDEILALFDRKQKSERLPAFPFLPFHLRLLH